MGLLVFAVFGVPAVFMLDADRTGVVVGGFVLLLIGVYLSEFVIIYHVALVAGADQALRGEAPDLVAAKRVARSPSRADRRVAARFIPRGDGTSGHPRTEDRYC